MIVLTTSTNPQTVYFIPREGTGNSDKIFLTDEQTNVTTTLNITTYATGDYYHTATATFGLIEGHTYICKIGKTNDIRFYGRVFCTDNPSSNFTQTVTSEELKPAPFLAQTLINAEFPNYGVFRDGVLITDNSLVD